MQMYGMDAVHYVIAGMVIALSSIVGGGVRELCWEISDIIPNYLAEPDCEWDGCWRWLLECDDA